MNQNPYTLLFGKPPITFIPRSLQKKQIIDEFSESVINNQAYVIVGLRGSGKTVFLRDISKYFDTLKDWIVVDLNAERNLLDDFVSSLNSTRKITNLFRSAKINLSYLGIGIEIDGVPPITNINVAAREMLAVLRKHKKRVLVTVDEITNSSHIREFALAFQSFIGAELPIFFLSTGLFENVRELEENKGSTFFARTPKIVMEPLKIRSVADSYMETFHLDQKTAYEMAALTKGYSFAFQVLGYFTWKANGNYKDVMEEYKSYLNGYSYEKIWSELSTEDHTFAYGIAKSESGKISDIRSIIQWDQNKVGPYRKRLMNKGILNTAQYGYLKFNLPFFDAFVTEKYEEMLYY